MAVNKDEEVIDKSTYICVADHIIELIMPSKINPLTAFPSCRDFLVSAIDSETIPVIGVKLLLQKNKVDLEDAKLRSDISVTWGDRFRFYETANHYITQVSGESDTESWNMVSSKDFKNSTIYVQSDEVDTSGILSWLIMVAFGQSVLLHQTVLIHASVIENEGFGYAFLGKSGTGKSTHARLWLKYVDNSILLNDDNPAIRIFEDGSVYIYGTPWSGKTPCYRNHRVKLGGIVRLQQAATNVITSKKGTEAMIAVLPSSSGLRWNSLLFEKMLNNLELIISKVPISYLKCLPNEEAALLSYNTIKNIK